MNKNAFEEQSLDYWKQRALNAEQEIDLLRRKIASIPERMEDLVRTSMKMMIKDQILKSKKVTVNGIELHAKERQYESGHAKLVLVSDNGLDSIEVSIDRPDVKREFNEIVFCNNEENQELIKIIQKAGLLNIFGKPRGL